MTSLSPVTDREYRALALVRYQIRRFLTFSESAARHAGIEPQQHQLLLAIRGIPSADAPSIATIAERLQIRQHSATELVTRAATAGLVQRGADPADARRATVRLTRRGAQTLERLSRVHRAELAESGRDLARALRALSPSRIGTAAKVGRSSRD